MLISNVVNKRAILLKVTLQQGKCLFSAIDKLSDLVIHAMTSLKNASLQKETVAQLKERLREHDLKLSGSKDELIARLLETSPTKKVNGNSVVT